MTQTGPARDHRSADDAAAGSAVVFVGGCDRSGTTIVSRLLAEQASLLVLPEAYFHAVAYRRYGDAATAEQAIGHWRRRSWGIDRHDPRAIGRPLADFLLDQMGDMYGAARGSREPLRVTESTPENIEVASILLDQFPNSAIVHTVRDPRAVAVSLQRADFGPTTAQECARFWKQRIASGLAAEARFPDRVIRIHYERAVTDPSELDDVVNVIGADERFSWESDRDFLVDPTSRSMQQRATSPLDPSLVDSWREHLRPSDVAVIEYECRELMMSFGYELFGGPDPRSSLRRNLDSSRSALSETTIGRGRRALRVARMLRPR